LRAIAGARALVIVNRRSIQLIKPHSVYHFTCTARLPWIIATRELQSYRDPISDFPNPDFVWATTRHQGDRTATGMMAYRMGLTALVRLTLSAADFEPWNAITERFPQWKADHVRRLEATARRMGQTSTDCWRVRAEPLPTSRVIKAEAKANRGSWQTIDLVYLQHPSDPAMRGVALDGTVYYATQRIIAGHTGYAPGQMSLQKWELSCDLVSAP
jgi:hypothetical protein